MLVARQEDLLREMQATLENPFQEKKKKKEPLGLMLTTLPTAITHSAIFQGPHISPRVKLKLLHNPFQHAVKPTITGNQ